MALHTIEGYIAADAGMTDSEIQDAIDKWVSKRTKWSPENGGWNGSVARTRPAINSGTEHLQFTVAFEWDSADKGNTLQKFADAFKNKVDWFAVLYHECKGHDDPSVDYDCHWEEERRHPDESTTIPQDVRETIPDDGQPITVVT